jgi:excisionase family DNA binding protein
VQVVASHLAFIPVARAARSLRINARKLRRAIRQGALPGYRIGNSRTVYLHPAELELWIRAQRVALPDAEAE